MLRRAGIEVTVAGLDGPGPVKASRGVVLLPDTSLDEALPRNYDMVVLPGGLPGADHLEQDPRIRQLVRRMAQEGRFVSAICAAPKVLASAGLLEGRRVTAYPGVLDALPGLDYSGGAVEQDGPVITSRGPGTAMDFALVLIERLAGREKRDQVEAGLKRP